MNRERLKDMKQDDAPAVYVIGQVSLQELQSYFQEYRGSIFFVQGLSGFNVVDLSCDGQLIEASRNAALKLCEKCDCLLLNLTAKDCIKARSSHDQLFVNSFRPCGVRFATACFLNAVRSALAGGL